MNEISDFNTRKCSRKDHAQTPKYVLHTVICDGRHFNDIWSTIFERNIAVYATSLVLSHFY